MLAGGSSAGKTTLGRKLQESLDGSWLLLGVDVLLWMLPPRLMRSAEGVAVQNGVITRGDEFMRIFAAFRSAVATLARSGINLLVDDVMLEADVDQRFWNDSLAGLDVCWVGIRCDPDVAAAREKARGDRPPGIARQQGMTVHEGVHYDLEIDTGVLDMAHAVDAVTDMVRRRWSVESTTATNDPPSYPVTNALSADAAPWES
jgi:chloramphenicol 3-O phosphotransferase